jgi:hypothetical protein
MTDKSKTSPAPPDIRLAKAFKFTGEDLAVNRSGYMSRRQERSPDIDYAILSLLSRIFRGRIAKPKREFRHVNSVCGRAKLRYNFVTVRVWDVGILPPHRSEGYRLTFDHCELEFRISEAQYRVLAEDIVYRVYYNPAIADKILSIERLDGGCDKT